MLTDMVYYRRGHHGRALEEAILTQKSQWPRKWKGVNPIHGGRSFENMTPRDRVSCERRCSGSI